MPIENTQNRSDLVRSLATTIQKKIVAPAADRVDIINVEMKEINQKIAVLEKELFLLAAAHSRTRALAAVAALGAAALAVILIIPFLK